MGVMLTYYLEICDVLNLSISNFIDQLLNEEYYDSRVMKIEMTKRSETTKATGSGNTANDYLILTQ